MNETKQQRHPLEEPVGVINCVGYRGQLVWVKHSGGYDFMGIHFNTPQEVDKYMDEVLYPTISKGIKKRLVT